MRLSRTVSKSVGLVLAGIRRYFGSDGPPTPATRWPRLGIGLSGGLLALVGVWLLAVLPLAAWALTLSACLLVFGLFNIVLGIRKNLTIARANQLSLIGHIVAVVSFYLILSRVLVVGYTTDTIVGTYLGVLKLLELQSPYGFSIKPLMDHLGFSTSYYTPGMNGTFDFHLAYPALSFLSLVPFYIIGMHDLRDPVFLFFMISVLLIFGLAPSRLKSISIAPFGLFPFVVANSWTDSVWAFFLVLTALFWYRHPKASWSAFGLAAATKQVAIVVAPFLLIRMWHERKESKWRSVPSAIAVMGGAFLLPNLPFIVASPGAWWTDIVAPYLPNSPSQVPGGIGLSNILLDIGIALQSSFYLVTMLGVSSLLLFAFARHYRGLNSLVFAFPIIMFFFYYRSFPNYMAFWVFPLVLDFCRLGGPNLKLLASIRMPTISWRPAAKPLLRPFRQRLTPSLVVLLVLTTAFAAASGAYLSQAATPKVQILVNSIADPDSIGSATQINVTLRNLLTTPVLPNFFVKYSPLPFVWETNSTAALEGGLQRSYLLSAPDAYSAVPTGYTFHVLVSDNLTSQLLGESSAAKAILLTPRVANPGLRWWVLDQSAGRKVPFDWKLSKLNVDTSTTGISPLGGVNGTSGLTFTLNYTSSSAGLGQVALSQKLLFNSTKVQLTLNQSSVTDIARKSMLLASISDGTHTVYYVFSNDVATEIVSQFSSNTTIIVPITTMHWNTITLDPQSLWNSLSWGIPQQVSLVVALETTVRGVYYASLFAIKSVSG